MSNVESLKQRIIGALEEKEFGVAKARPYNLIEHLVKADRLSYEKIWDFVPIFAFPVAKTSSGNSLDALMQQAMGKFIGEVSSYKGFNYVAGLDKKYNDDVENPTIVFPRINFFVPKGRKSVLNEVLEKTKYFAPVGRNEVHFRVSLYPSREYATDILEHRKRVNPASNLHVAPRLFNMNKADLDNYLALVDNPNSSRLQDV